MAAEFETGDHAAAGIAEILGLVITDTGQVLVQRGGEPSLLAAMSHAVNGAALMVATILVLWSGLSAAADTAHEGVLFGRRYHSMWVPLRSALAIGVLLPMVGGYSLVQVGVVLMAGLGFKSADLAWQAALEYIQNSGPVVNVAPAHSTALAHTLFKSNLCMLRLNALYLHGEKTLKIVVREQETTTRDNHRHYRLSFDGAPGSGLGPGKCGEFSISHEQTAIGARMHEGSKASIRTLSLRLNQLAYRFIDGGDTQEELAAALRRASDEYAQHIRAAASRALRGGADAMSHSNRQFFAEAKEAGWMMAGAWFWTLSAVNRRIADTVRDAPGFKLPNPDNMPSDWQLAISQEFLRAERTVINRRHEIASAGARGEGFGGLHDKIAGWTHKPMILALDYVNELLNSEGEPVVALQSFGHGMISVAELLVAGAIIGEALGTGALEGARGNILARAADTLTLGGKLDFLRGVGSTLLEWATVIVVGLALPVLLAGLTLAFWLPAVPFVYWIAGIVGWLILLLEALFVAPLWAAAHAAAAGEGISSYHGRPGYMLVLTLAARPLMMVLGLFSAMLIMHYGSRFLLHTFTPFVRGMHTHTLTGIVSLIAMLLLLTALVTAMVNRAHTLIYTLPETILNYIDINSVPGPRSAQFSGETHTQFAQGLSASREVAGPAPGGNQTTAPTPASAHSAQAKKDAEDLTPGIIIAREIPQDARRTS